MILIHSANGAHERFSNKTPQLTTTMVIKKEINAFSGKANLPLKTGTMMRRPGIIQIEREHKGSEALVPAFRIFCIQTDPLQAQRRYPPSDGGIQPGFMNKYLILSDHDGILFRSLLIST